MRLSEREYLDLLGKKKVQRIILPVKLPTWNAILAMGIWQRKKLRDAIHGLIANVVSTSITSVKDLQTQTVFRLKQRLIPFAELEYSQTITPESLRKYRRAKRKVR
jgi:hypothetical protein